MAAQAEAPAATPLSRAAALVHGEGCKRLLIGVAVILALLVVVADVLTLEPGRGTADAATPLAPVAAPTPGDQVRPYSPRYFPPAGTGPAHHRVGPRERPAGRLRLEVHPEVEGRPAALAQGVIGTGAADEVERFLAGYPEVRVVVLESPGGRMTEALRIGELIRGRELDTAVLAGGWCASSCPIVLAAGTQRLVSREALVGLHQAYVDGDAQAVGVADAVSGVQAAHAAVIGRLDSWGIDTRVWLNALATPAEAIYLLTEDELESSGFATRWLDG